MKYRIYAGAVLLAVLAAAVFGFSKRQTFTDLRREADFPDQLSVAQLSLSLTQMDCERMAQELPQAPYIFRVRVLEDVEFLFGASRQKVQVEEVYAGETVLPGDVLYLTGHCSLCLSVCRTQKSRVQLHQSPCTGPPVSGVLPEHSGGAGLLYPGLSAVSRVLDRPGLLGRLCRPRDFSHRWRERLCPLFRRQKQRVFPRR